MLCCARLRDAAGVTSLHETRPNEISGANPKAFRNKLDYAIVIGPRAVTA
jgi:hypothetical protein